MILILSSPFDHATAQVVAWLNHFDVPWLRLNQYLNDDKKRPIEFNINLSDDSPTEIICKIFSSDTYQDLSKINVVWFRRILVSLPIITEGTEDWINDFHNSLSKIKTDEKTAFIDSLRNALKDKYWLSSPETANTNKFQQLLIAQKVGLKIPGTLLTTTKDELKKFKHRHGKIITKALQNIPHVKADKRNSLMLYTNTVSEQDIYNLPERFYPSIFQQCLDKEFEIRSFYLEGTFFSCAMFSQYSERTQIDFRRVDSKKPSRLVPYKLPNAIETKLSNLMALLNLNTGSMDIIYNGKDYYFLEVNPVGQFGFGSYPCNYLIEKHIAKFLQSKCLSQRLPNPE